MKTTSSLRHLALAGAATCLLAAFPARAHAAFVFTLSQVGANVVVTGSGTLNTTALTFQNTTAGPIEIDPAGALLAAGAGTGDISLYTGLKTSPASFGSGATTFGTGTGDQVVIYGQLTELFVPNGYVSGTALADTETFTNATFASLGFTPGTYTYTWGSGATADSLTVTSVVPEPSTWASLAVGVAGLDVAALRRHRSRAA